MKRSPVCWPSSSKVFPDRKNDLHYLDACRAKRNTAEYDCVGVVTPSDADELIGFVKEFRPVVLAWLRENHRDLL